MSFVLSVVFTTLALIFAARLMNVGLSIIQALLVVGVSQAASFAFEGRDGHFQVSGLIITLVIHFVGLKLFTGENLWTSIKLTLLSMLLFVVIVLGLMRLF